MARCVACFGVLVAEGARKGRDDGMKRAIFLATAALLAMLILAPMAWTQQQSGHDFMIGTTVFAGGGGSGGSTAPTPLEDTGGPAILLPAAALLLGSGILTYAILRRR